MEKNPGLEPEWLEWLEMYVHFGITKYIEFSLEMPSPFALPNFHLNFAALNLEGSPFWECATSCAKTADHNFPKGGGKNTPENRDGNGNFLIFI